MLEQLGYRGFLISDLEEGFSRLQRLLNGSRPVEKPVINLVSAHLVAHLLKQLNTQLSACLNLGHSVFQIGEFSQAFIW